MDGLNHRCTGRSVTPRLMVVAGAVAFLITAGSSAVFATPLGANLIVNPGAELGTGAADWTTTVAPTGWRTTSNFSAVQYAAPGVPDSLHPADSTAIGGGNNYFAGGPNDTSATASQDVPFADLATSVDRGMISFILSGYLGGYDGQADNMRIALTFLNAANAVLSTVNIGPIDGSRLVSQLLPFTTDRTGTIVPIGARSATITLTAARLAGDYNDGYADNLSLQLQEIPTSEVPEPTSVALLGLGLVGMAGRFAKRRHR
jgi:hypothetical protein